MGFKVDNLASEDQAGQKKRRTAVTGDQLHSNFTSSAKPMARAKISHDAVALTRESIARLRKGASTS